jgi:hypothetical protein
MITQNMLEKQFKFFTIFKFNNLSSSFLMVFTIFLKLSSYRTGCLAKGKRPLRYQDLVFSSPNGLLSEVTDFSVM